MSFNQYIIGVPERQKKEKRKKNHGKKDSIFPT